MNESQIKSVALFFFYAFMDDRLATKAATATIRECNRSIAKDTGSKEDSVNSLIVKITHKKFLRLRPLAALGMSGLSSEKGWKLPPRTDLGPWKEFQRRAPVEEVLAVVWSKILGFSDEIIAEGLSVSPGTISYRVGNGLKALGQVTAVEERRL